MAEPNPPAGWYADSERPGGERWWDGNAWTEHRRLMTAAAPAATPFAGPPRAPMPWYQTKSSIAIAIGLVVVVLVAIGVAVAHNSGGDHSKLLEQSIMRDGQTQLQANLAQIAPSAAVVMDDAGCVETANTQNYTCLVHYTVTDPSAGSQKYLLHVSGTCSSGGHCQWHADGEGIPVAQ